MLFDTSDPCLLAASLVFHLVFRSALRAVWSSLHRILFGIYWNAKRLHNWVEGKLKVRRSKHRFVMFFRGYQTPEVTGTQNTLLHIILISRDTFKKKKKTGSKGLFFFFQNCSNPKLFDTEESSHTVRTASSVATSQKHPACHSQLFAESTSPLTWSQPHPALCTRN